MAGRHDTSDADRHSSGPPRPLTSRQAGHPRPLPNFPVYTMAEQRADLVVHVVGLAGAAILVPWLLIHLGPDATRRQIGSVAVYLAGLLGMLSASAAYNLARPGRRKALLRRLDRSMIYVMIAGSYTPFALDALAPSTGFTLCLLVWIVAGLGIALELTPGSRLHYNLGVALYLAMGWIVVLFVRPIVAALPIGTVVLLAAGGVVYTAGSILHARGRLLFHNAIWHALVAVAALLHFVAIATLFPRPA